MWEGSHGHKEGERWGFRSGRRLTSCLRGGGSGKFSAGWWCAGAGCRFTSWEATRSWYQVCLHLPSTRRFLVFNSCHLDTDWTSSNQWAGRRCVPHGRGFGCQRITPELVCLPILTTFGWNGGSRVHTRPLGLRQGTTVCVHTSMDMEQLSDHKLITPSGVGLLVCGAGSRPSCHPGVPRGNMPTGVNLNRYAGPGSLIRWHSDNEPLFGPQYSPKLIISVR